MQVLVYKVQSGGVSFRTAVPCLLRETVNTTLNFVAYHVT